MEKAKDVSIASPELSPKSAALKVSQDTSTKYNVPMCIYIGGCHVFAFYAICYFSFGWNEPASPVKHSTLVFAFLLWPISGLGITAGAHRLWSHRSYEASFLLKAFLMLCNSIANQSSIWHWARDHRTHHLHSDTKADPYNSNRGFFYAHVGWLLTQKPVAVRDAGRKIDMSDLNGDLVVSFQKRFDPYWNFAWCFIIPAIFSVWAFDDTLWHGFLFAGVLRYVYVLHCTWSVNSLVHGTVSSLNLPSPYDTIHPPSESRLVSFLAIGEGWHSWHHAFPFCYACSELGCFQQYNPTKLFLDSCYHAGLVWNRKRGTRMWCERKARMVERFNSEGKDLQETLTGPPMWRVRKIEVVERQTKESGARATCR